MTDGEQIIEIIKQLENQRYAAMLNSDVEELDRLMSERSFFLHSSAYSDTKAQYLDTLRSGTLVYKNIERSDTDYMTFADNIAYVRERVKSDVKIGDKSVLLDNIIVAVWVLEDGHWRIVSSQSTPVPK